MTKRRDQHSAKEAFLASILALKPDPSTGACRLERASQLTGMAVRSLYSACDPSPTSGKGVPLRLEWAELIDVVNCREGGEPLNLTAWVNRHGAAVEGVTLPAPTPEKHLEQAIADLKAGLALYEAGGGDPVEINRHIATIQGLLPDLLRVWSDRLRPRDAKPTDTPGGGRRIGQT